MKKLIGTSAVAALLAIGLTSAPADAKGMPPAEMLSCAYDLPEADYCNAELQYLCAAIENGDFANDRDRFNLIGKVIETALKVNDSKFADADQKLGDIQQKVDQLDSAGKFKIDPDTADAITYARIEASICVSGLGVE